MVRYWVVELKAIRAGRLMTLRLEGVLNVGGAGLDGSSGQLTGDVYVGNPGGLLTHHPSA
jgi:hypothetical protein